MDNKQEYLQLKAQVNALELNTKFRVKKLKSTTVFNKRTNQPGSKKHC